MKKILAFLLSLCVLLLCACGSDGVENSKEPSLDNTEDETSDALSSEQSSAEASESSDLTSEETTEESVIEAFCGGRFDGKSSVKLVALGDSIARGFGLSDPATQAYPALVSASVEKALGGIKVEYTNLAVDGMTTEGLLTLLQSNPSVLEGTDIVTLCIGANNILGPFTVALNGLGGFSGGVTEDPNAFGVFMDNFNALIKGEKFAEDMRGGITKAATDLPQIIKLIKERSPEAIVAIMTVYSPYHGIVMSIPYLGKSVNMGEVSDLWVDLLNKEIIKVASEEDVLLVDTYSAFAEGTDLVNARFNLLPFRLSFDPHPTLNGHNKLAELYMAEFSKM